MSFLTRPTFRRRWSPRHQLACDVMLWRQLVADLRRRSAGRRESGAFLLGDIGDDVRTITDYVMYDTIDPHALDSGYVHVDGRHLGQLWDICRKRKTSVVADIHTHPGGYGQSAIDRKESDDRRGRAHRHHLAELRGNPDFAKQHGHLHLSRCPGVEDGGEKGAA